MAGVRGTAPVVHRSKTRRLLQRPLCSWKVTRFHDYICVLWACVCTCVAGGHVCVRVLWACMMWECVCMCDVGMCVCTCVAGGHVCVRVLWACMMWECVCMRDVGMCVCVCCGHVCVRVLWACVCVCVMHTCVHDACTMYMYILLCAIW